jgi:hypothetical protein
MEPGEGARAGGFIHSVTCFVPRRWRKAGGNPTNKPERNAWKEARREKVARAKQLIEDASYPPRQVLKAVAETLAQNINFWRLLPFLHL